MQLSNEQMYVNVPWTNTNNAVTQTNLTDRTSKEYRVLLSGSADDTTKTEGVLKSALKYNPLTPKLSFSGAFSASDIEGQIQNASIVSTSNDTASPTAWSDVEVVSNGGNKVGSFS